jgi:hypothetical protein
MALCELLESEYGCTMHSLQRVDSDRTLYGSGAVFEMDSRKLLERQE